MPKYVTAVAVLAGILVAAIETTSAFSAETPSVAAKSVTDPAAAVIGAAPNVVTPELAFTPAQLQALDAAVKTLTAQLAKLTQENQKLREQLTGDAKLSNAKIAAEAAAVSVLERKLAAQVAKSDTTETRLQKSLALLTTRFNTHTHTYARTQVKYENLPLGKSVGSHIQSLVNTQLSTSGPKLPPVKVAATAPVTPGLTVTPVAPDVP